VMAYLLFACQIAVIVLLILMAIRSENRLKGRLRKKIREQEQILALAGRAVSVLGSIGAVAGKAVVRGLSTLLGEGRKPWEVDANEPTDLLEDRPGVTSFTTHSFDLLLAADEGFRIGEAGPICELIEVLYAIRNGILNNDVKHEIDSTIHHLGALMNRDMGAQISIFQPGDQVDTKQCDLMSRQSTNHTIQFVHGIYCSTELVTIRAKVST